MISDPRVDLELVGEYHGDQALSTLADGVSEQYARVATDLDVVIPVACDKMLCRHGVARNFSSREHFTRMVQLSCPRRRHHKPGSIIDMMHTGQRPHDISY